jgi:hypothetical protein
MNHSITALWVVAGLLAASSLGVSGRRYIVARDSAAREMLVFQTVSHQSADLSRLRSAAPAWVLHGRPVSGLAPRISADLSTSGLPASTMAGLSPEAVSALPVGTDLPARRTRATLTLAPITLPQLGSFLAAWRTREPDWAVASIDLSPQSQSGKERAAAGGDLPLRTVIGIECLFVDQPGDKP